MIGRTSIDPRGADGSLSIAIQYVVSAQLLLRFGEGPISSSGFPLPDADCRCGKDGLLGVSTEHQTAGLKALSVFVPGGHRLRRRVSVGPAGVDERKPTKSTGGDLEALVP